jgi:hypothetical protein
MKKTPLVFLALFALSLCSFAIYENYEDNSPIEEAQLTQYLSQFRAETLPYTINKKSQDWMTQPLISSKHTHFIPYIIKNSFSRIGPTIYRSDALIASNDRFYAVIYTEKSPIEHVFPNFFLQTIDKKGDVIATQSLIKEDYFLSQEQNIENEASVIINADLSIKMTMLRYDFTTKSNILVTKNWQITESGEIRVIPAEEIASEKSMKKG